MRIIDMHCDTLLEGWRNPAEGLRSGKHSINLELLKGNDSLAQFFACYLSRDEMKTMDPYDIFKGIYGFYIKSMEENKDLIRPAFSAEDILTNQEAGLLSSILTIEDGVFLDGKIERVQEVYDMGVRLITLTWNFENSVGFPCRDDHEAHMKGLKPFGIEVVEKMNELGMIIDVSHLSEGGFYDVAKYSKQPFAASHSCARTLCNHRRNLTDDQLKTLGEAGGIVGASFGGFFLKEGINSPTIEQVLQHMVYMKNKAGIDAVGLGSDFDGIDDTGEFVDYSGFSRLLTAMEGKFTDDEIDKITHLNALRVIRDVMGN